MYATPHTLEQIERARADYSRELDHKSMIGDLMALVWNEGIEPDMRELSREAFRCLEYDA